MHIQAYLKFNGRCDEAIAFYQKALGAQVQMLMRFSESPAPMPPGSLPPGSENKVMHSSLRIGDSVVMATDGDCTGRTAFDGISLTLNVADAAEAERVFAALSDGGQVRMPLAKTFFSSSFGMLADRFGVGWLIIVPQAQ